MVQITCPHCKNEQEYKVRNSVPFRPKTICKKCKKWIYPERNKIIDNLTKNEKTKHDQKTKFGQPNEPYFDQNIKNIIFGLDDNKRYVSEICRKTSLSSYKITKILNRLVDQEQLIRIEGKPIFYSLTKKSKIEVPFSKKIAKIENKKKDIIPENHFRIHNVVFENDLIERPERLPDKIKAEWEGHPFVIKITKRTKMNNWDYFDIKLPLTLFGGLHNIRLTPQKALYHFKRPYENQYVPIRTSACEEYVHERGKDAQRARDYILGKFHELGVNLDIEFADPKLNKSPECAVNLNGKFYMGTMVKGHLKLKNGQVIDLDDSQNNGLGELEGDIELMEKAFIKTPERVDQLDQRIHDFENELPKTIAQEISKELDKFKITFAKELTTQMSAAVGSAVTTALKNAFSNDPKSPGVNNSGNMFQ